MYSIDYVQTVLYRLRTYSSLLFTDAVLESGLNHVQIETLSFYRRANYSSGCVQGQALNSSADFANHRLLITVY